MPVTLRSDFLTPILATFLVALGVGFFAGTKHTFRDKPAVSKISYQDEMDAYCSAKLNESLSTLSSADKKGQTDKAFFSLKLHTCVHIAMFLDPNNPEAMDYSLSDLTYGFVAPPKWHHSEIPLHIFQLDIGSSHRLSTEGYWTPVTSELGEESTSDANAVKLTCDYIDNKKTETNVCTEIEAYTQSGTIHTDTQTFHIASWSQDEVIATDSERGLSGATTTTLLIHPTAKEIEVVVRTKMDEKQPDLFKGMAGKSFGNHSELHGGSFVTDTQAFFFDCNQAGVQTDMRFDVVKKHHGDVVDVPRAEWNVGSNANHKFTPQECKAAMQKELEKLQ